MLIEGGADVNQKDISGNTPLLLAFSNTHSDIALALARRGADLCATNNDQFSVLDEIIEEINQLYPGRLSLQLQLLGDFLFYLSF